MNTNEPTMKSDSPYIFNIDGDEFQQKVIDASHTQPVLVDFWADWCSPCLMIAPVLAKVIPEYEGKVLLAKIDADENMKLAGHYKLRGFPTIIMFVNGEGSPFWRCQTCTGDPFLHRSTPSPVAEIPTIYCVFNRLASLRVCAILR